MLLTGRSVLPCSREVVSSTESTNPVGRPRAVYVVGILLLVLAVACELALRMELDPASTAAHLTVHVFVPDDTRRPPADFTSFTVDRVTCDAPNGPSRRLWSVRPNHGAVLRPGPATLVYGTAPVGTVAEPAVAPALTPGCYRLYYDGVGSLAFLEVRVRDDGALEVISK